MLKSEIQKIDDLIQQQIQLLNELKQIKSKLTQHLFNLQQSIFKHANVDTNYNLPIDKASATINLYSPQSCIKKIYLSQQQESNITSHTDYQEFHNLDLLYQKILTIVNTPDSAFLKSLKSLYQDQRFQTIIPQLLPKLLNLEVFE